MRDELSGIRPILCAPLLRRVDEKLIRLLRGLSPEEWEIQTLVSGWKVRDVVAHLLDTPLRKLSMVRDSCFVEQPMIRSAQDVADLVNRLNREGVAVFRRLSPRVLIDLMETACGQSADFHESLDPYAPAVFNVTWAGEAISPNWFDTARELTERWHHQQQIRLATDRPSIMSPELYFPVLDCFARGLPHAFREIDAVQGATIQLDITGDCGGTWLLRRGPLEWSFADSAPSEPDAHVSIPQEFAWRVFTKGIHRAEAIALSSIEGDHRLGQHVFTLTSIVG